MENLSEIQKLHYQVQKDIFRILNEYNVLTQTSSSLPSRIALFYFTEDYKTRLYESPMEVASFINSVNRLVETGYLKIITTRENDLLFFIKAEEYQLLSEIEQEYWSGNCEKQIRDMLMKNKVQAQLLG